MSRIFVVVVAVLVLLGSAVVADLAYQNHEPNSTSDQEFQDDLVGLFGDTIDVAALFPILLLTGLALAAVRVVGGGR